ncbi:hypothetical protein ACHAXR_012098 [Thalassiosira sp. AJA248-18]
MSFPVSILALQLQTAPYVNLTLLDSFQNSGTSFTSELVRRVARQNTASNYGTEDLGASVAVFEDSPEGPFWTDAHNNELARPTRGFILVKTHCGGYCDSCPPDKYIEDAQIFTRNCASGYHFTKDGNGEPQKVLDSYSKELVGRAVHLIRDPFDNIVSRFHLTYKQFVVSNQTEKIANYPRSKEGFRSFCRDMGETFYEEEKSTEVYRDVFDVMTNVPCHADFFRYIQWHNLAFTTTTDIRIPTMIIHYENYTDNFNQTKDMLLEFLGQSAISEPPPFETGKTYREYFTDEEVQAVSTMFSKLGMDETWDRTKHYFV